VGPGRFRNQCVGPPGGEVKAALPEEHLAELPSCAPLRHLANLEDPRILKPRVGDLVEAM
jgi:hypothetical protein